MLGISQDGARKPMSKLEAGHRVPISNVDGRWHVLPYRLREAYRQDDLRCVVQLVGRLYNGTRQTVSPPSSGILTKHRRILEEAHDHFALQLELPVCCIAAR
jgi:hypothetical protein